MQTQAAIHLATLLLNQGTFQFSKFEVLMFDARIFKNLHYTGQLQTQE